MENIEFIIIMILITIMIIFYGGKNNVHIVEYNSNYFDNYNNIYILKNKLNNYKMDNLNYTSIEDINNILNIILPNYINNYYIKIEPYSYFEIKNVINQLESKNQIMLIYNHNNYKNIELLVNTDYQNDKKIGYFYNLTKELSITNMFDIYNNNDKKVYITIFILKKPYWYY